MYVFIFRYCYCTECTFVVSNASLVSSITEHAVKTYGGTAPLILTFGTRCGWEVSLAIKPFYSRGQSPIAHRTRGWAIYKGGLDVSEKRCLLSLSGTKSLLSVVQSVA